MLTPAELSDLGFRLIVSPLSLLLAATKAIQDAASHLATQGTMRDSLDPLVTFDGFTDVVGLPEHLAAEARYRQ